MLGVRALRGAPDTRAGLDLDIGIASLAAVLLAGEPAGFLFGACA